MRRLLMTTILASALSTGMLTAQTTTTTGAEGSLQSMTAPEGYSLQETQLTAEMLIGAKIYDTTGDAIGEVHDLVFDVTAPNAASGGSNTPAAAPLPSDATAPDGSAAPGGMSGDSSNTAPPAAGSPSATESGSTNTPGVTGGAASGPDSTANDSNTPTAESGRAAPGTNDVGAVGAQNTVNGDDALRRSGQDAPDSARPAEASPGTASDTAEEGSTAPIASGEGNTSDPITESNAGQSADSTTTTGDVAADGTYAGGSVTGPPDNTDAGAAARAAASGADTGMTATAPGATSGRNTAGAETGGRITHALLDVGGFLGMGQHRVAVPVSDLAVYGNGSDLRVYLPWSRDQLKALPAYDENNPATLGSSPAPANN